MNLQLRSLSLFVIVHCLYLVDAFNAAESWRGVKWRINVPTLPPSQPRPVTTTIATVDDSTQYVRLVDWRDWSSMRSTYVHNVRSPPLLIVDAASSTTTTSISTTTSLPPSTTTISSIPEAALEEEDDDTMTTSTASSTLSTSTFTIATASTTTTTSAVETSTSSDTFITDAANNDTSATMTTTAASTKPSDITLSLQNLPDMTTILKHLALIPAVVRSFSSAAITSSATNTDAAPQTATNPLVAMLSGASSPRADNLHSRALSANSGYGNGNSRTSSLLAPSTAAIGGGGSVDSEALRPIVNAAGARFAPAAINVPTPSGGATPIVPVVHTHTRIGSNVRPREIPAVPLVNAATERTTFATRASNLNIYGLESPSAASDQYRAPMLSSLVEPRIDTEEPRNEPRHRERPRFDLADLTVGEVEQLEAIHRKLFRDSASTTPIPAAIRPLSKAALRPLDVSSPLVEGGNLVHVFKKPAIDMAERVHNAAAALPTTIAPSTAPIDMSALQPDQLQELALIKNLPNLDELTRGLDLTLFNRPGGWAQLKEQFLQRLIQQAAVKQHRRRRMRNRRL